MFFKVNSERLTKLLDFGKTKVATDMLLAFQHCIFITQINGVFKMVLIEVYPCLDYNNLPE